MAAGLSAATALTTTYLDGMDYPTAQHADQEYETAGPRSLRGSRTSTTCMQTSYTLTPTPATTTSTPTAQLDLSISAAPQSFPRNSGGYGWRSFALRSKDAPTAAVDVEPTGLFTANSELANDELQQWSSYAYYPMTAPHPVTLIREAVARIVGGFFDAHDRDYLVTKINVPPELAFTSRIVLAFNSVIAGLRATLPIPAIFVVGKAISIERSGGGTQTVPGQRAAHAPMFARLGERSRIASLGPPGAVSHHRGCPRYRLDHARSPRPDAGASRGVDRSAAAVAARSTETAEGGLRGLGDSGPEAAVLFVRRSHLTHPGGGAALCRRKPRPLGREPNLQWRLATQRPRCRRCRNG